MADTPDDYLWDGTGDADVVVQRLETVLVRYRSADPPPPLRLPDLTPAPAGWTWRTVAAVAALLLLSIGVSWLTYDRRPAVVAEPWRIASVLGSPTIDRAPAVSRTRLDAGRWLETDRHSSAILDVGRIGRLNVAPQTRLRLIESSEGEHRVALDRGSIEAQIWAPPGRFFVETASATAIDLGCAYTLTVDDAGTGTLSVTAGWVGLEHRGRESFIPADASARTYPKLGPGVPTFDDASAALRAAVRALDTARGAEAQQAAVDVVVREARPQDAVTLWHLIDRVDRSLAGRVIDRRQVLAPAPPGVTRDGVLSGNRAMRDQWWEALGLGSAAWWRTWRQK
ncbi:MAG: hypothetical protein ACR2LU_02440 [Luteitalea sp.]